MSNVELALERWGKVVAAIGEPELLPGLKGFWIQEVYGFLVGPGKQEHGEKTMLVAVTIIDNGYAMPRPSMNYSDVVKKGLQ